MPDRNLTDEELFKFLNEKKLGKIFKALKVFEEENTQPTLHDLCIIELDARTAAMTEVLIEQGRKIDALKEELLAIKARLSKGGIYH